MLNSTQTSYYNIHGFIMSVQGSLCKYLRDYEWARIRPDHDVRVNLYVKIGKPNIAEDILTKPLGSIYSMYIPFREGENTLWYEEGCPLNILGCYIKALMHWPDKALLHAGTVAIKNESFVFTGGGNTGKTSIVLNLLRKGYEFLSDDYVVVGGGNAYILSTLINLSYYYLKVKEVAELLGLKYPFLKTYLNLIKNIEKIVRHRYLRYALDVIVPSFSVDVRKLFPEVKITHSSKIRKVFYLERGPTSKIEVTTDITARDLAMKMAFYNLYEQNFLFREYYKYAFYYCLKNRNLENRFKHDFDIFYNSFKEKQIYKVIIPRDTNLVDIDLTSILPLP